MTDVRLELPFPDRRLSPNARVHWREKAKVVAQYRETVAWTAVASRSEHQRQRVLGTPEGGIRKPLKPPVRAAVTFVVPTRHKRDEDNLLASLKPAWDGLVDAGVLAGDDSERFSVESCEVVAAHAHSSGCVNTYPDCEEWVGEPKVIVVLRSA